MNSWPILDVAIGLVFVYLLLSLICTTLNEGLMTQFRSRAKYLDRGILALLGSEKIKKQFFEHPLIQSYQNTAGDSVIRRAGRAIKIKSATSDQCPSYLSGFVFARALHDLLKDPAKPTLNEIIGDRIHAAAGDPAKADELRLVTTLRAVLANAVGAKAELALLKDWYEHGMDRVTGWYKRHAQAWVRLFAIVIVLVLNADTIQIARRLWVDPTVRAQVVDAAKARAERGKAANYELDEEGGNSPQTTDTVGTDKTQTIGEYGGEITDKEKDVIGNLIGWDTDWQQRDALRDNKGKVSWPNEVQFWSGEFKQHWLGWLLSIVAVSLGAPFWFDLLKRLMNIRNAGQAPDQQPNKNSSSPEVEDAA